MRHDWKIDKPTGKSGVVSKHCARCKTGQTMANRLQDCIGQAPPSNVVNLAKKKKKKD